MNSYLLSYLFHCILGLTPTTELCKEVLKIDEANLEDARMISLLRAIKGGNPLDPELQSEMVFLTAVECKSTLSKYMQV